MAVDDFADACVFVLKHYSEAEIINIGTGKDITISEFARCVADVVGYEGEIEFDHGRPDGMPRKLLDVSKLARLGWQSKISLREGLIHSYRDFIATAGNRRH
jgi:GDP-L-fucose synthase